MRPSFQLRFGLSGVAILALGGSPTAPMAAPAPDVAIRGGLVYTGAEEAPFVGDVEITGDRITYVGPSRKGAANREIQAAGAIVTPGLIDAHTHPDTYIRSTDRAVRVNAPWLLQGVTTIVVGPDGIGTPDVAAEMEGFRSVGVGVNLVPLVGFGAVRQRIMGEAARAPTPDDLARMRALVAKAMCEGASGFSTGLFYAPQSYAATEEVIALAREAGLRGGLYDTHPRDESDYSIGLLASTDEAIRIGREAQMPVHIAHLKALGLPVQGMAPQLIARIQAARADGVDVTADQYPWLASGSSLEAALVPKWAVDGGLEALEARLQDPKLLERIRSEMAANLRRRGGADAVLLTSADRPWTGKTLAQMAATWQVDPLDAALRILRYVPPGAPVATNRIIQNDANGAIASFNMINADVDLIMKQPWVMTSSDGSDGHPRQAATFPQKYSIYVRKRGVIDMNDFVRRSTGLTADTYRIDHRGYLRTGYFADVTVIDPQAYAPRADYVHPERLSVGVKALLVNGELAVMDGAVTGALAGRPLLRTPPKDTCPSAE